MYFFEQQREIESTYPLVYFPNALNGRSWDKPKPGAKNSAEISNMGGRNPIYLGHHHGFPGHALTGNESGTGGWY